MRAGDIVNGYALLEDFRVVGAGLSEWTFAVRDRREFFIKRFLSPTYPDDDAPGSAKTKAAKRARCAAFEAHHRGILAALAPVTSYGGNLIATLDFFRSGAKYYKVTEKVDLAGLDITDVANLPFPTRLVLLKTVAHSLKILHDLSIVHSDLRPSNVMIKQTELGYTTKLIDFDSSYMVGSPPPPEEIVGTMNYYSPELVRYIQGTGKASELTSASRRRRPTPAAGKPRGPGNAGPAHRRRLRRSMCHLRHHPSRPSLAQPDPQADGTVRHWTQGTGVPNSRGPRLSGGCVQRRGPSSLWVAGLVHRLR